MFESMLLSEGWLIFFMFMVTITMGIMIGIDVESNNSGATGGTVLLLPALFVIVLAIFYNYTARDVTIQYLLKDKTERQIKEMNATKDIKKVIIYNYLKMKHDELDKSKEDK